ncbi:MAG: DegT/DnrJ/EryC1/StrS family aminotransferase [Paludibacter sp.]|nr:DegT/DnrJ/EryC1/StrS family aminotransferase [Paludibacter sp.]
MRVDFSPPYIDQSVVDQVVDTLKSGWITTGNKVKLLESEIKSYTGSQSVLCVNSWTSGAIMMLRWLGLKPGDEVIIPAYTYAATALAVMHAGGIPVMVDICDDFNISLTEIRNAITPKTKAIIPVDVAGLPCDYKEIMQLVNESEVKAKFIPTSKIQEQLNRILVLIDAAHSFGGKYNDKNIGVDADLTIFSLHAVKNLTTAEGGAICINMPLPFDNSNLYEELRSMSMNCQSKDAYAKSIAGCWKYDIVGFGMKINMPDVNAAIGLAQLRKFMKLLSKRKKISNHYQESFSKYKWAILPTQYDAVKESAYHVFPLRIKDITEVQRDEIISEISKLDIATNVHYIPLPMFSFFKESGYDISNYPNSYKNFACEISLPIYPQLTEEEVDFVIKSVKESYEKVVLNR